jgi:hypothetical protein
MDLPSREDRAPQGRQQLKSTNQTRRSASPKPIVHGPDGCQPMRAWSPARRGRRAGDHANSGLRSMRSPGSTGLIGLSGQATAVQRLRGVCVAGGLQDARELDTRMRGQPWCRGRLGGGERPPAELFGAAQAVRRTTRASRAGPGQRRRGRRTRLGPARTESEHGTVARTTSEVTGRRAFGAISVLTEADAPREPGIQHDRERPGIRRGPDTFVQDVARQCSPGNGRGGGDRRVGCGSPDGASPILGR